MNGRPLSLFLALAALTLSSAAIAAEPVKLDAEAEIMAASGLWYTEDKDGVIELYPCEEELCGKFFWVEPEPNGEISRDTHNPDPEKRKTPLCGTQFMGGFTPEGNGKFESGWIYSPRHGSNFSAHMRLENPDKLVLHGYFLFPMLGEDQVWARANKSEITPCDTNIAN